MNPEDPGCIKIFVRKIESAMKNLIKLRKGSLLVRNWKKNKKFDLKATKMKAIC